MIGWKKEKPGGFELPTQPPSANARQDEADWTALVDSAYDMTIATAERWRVGLAGIVTVVSAVLVVKGPEATAGLTRPWRWAVVLLLMGALALLLVGLWRVLAASAPISRVITRDDFQSTYGDLRNYRRAVAADVADRTRTAAHWVAGGLVALSLAIVAWWVAPIPSSVLKVEQTVQGATIVTCGEPIGSGKGTIVIRTSSGTRVAIRLSSADSVEVVDAC